VSCVVEIMFQFSIFSGGKMYLVGAFKSQNRKVDFETDGKNKSQVKEKLEFLLKTNF